MFTHSSFLYISTVLIWGSSWFAIKFQLGTVAEEVSLVYRFAIASALLLAYCLITRRRMAFTLSQHFFIALQGVFLFATNYLVIYWATHTLSSGLIAVAFSTIIVMNIIGSAIAFRQAISTRVVVGALIGVVGVGLIFWPEVSTFDMSTAGLHALLFAFLGTLFASVGNILSARNQKQGLPVVQTNAWGMGYGASFMALWALLSGTPFNFETTTGYVGSLLFLSLFASIFAFGGYLTLLGRIGADRAAYAMVVFPVVALAISTVFEGYTWTAVAAGGLALVLVGNVVVLRKSKAAKPDSDPSSTDSHVTQS
ncbi:MAG: EamA family transporter [Pseudomonadota bacterium]